LRHNGSIGSLKHWTFDVVTYGPSLHDENTSYGSDHWRKRPREAMLALIESYTDIVLEVDEIIVEGLRK
jgi:hypothetical protein